MYIFHIHNIFQYQWYKLLIINKVYKLNLFHPSFFNLKLKLIFRSLLQIKTQPKIPPPQKKPQLDGGGSACICKGCWGCCNVTMLQMWLRYTKSLIRLVHSRPSKDSRQSKHFHCSAPYCLSRSCWFSKSLYQDKQTPCGWDTFYLTHRDSGNSYRCW